MFTKFKTIVPGLFLVLFSNLKTYAQYPTDKEIFFDSLKTLWSDSKQSDKAANWAIEFKRQWPNSFNGRIEKTLVPILHSSKNASAERDFVEKLYLKNDSTIHAFISPIYFWSKIQTTDNKKNLAILTHDFTLLLNDSANYLNRTERYGLMILNELESKNNADEKSISTLRNKIISNLEKFYYLDRTDAPAGTMMSWQRHWFRCLYAFTFYQKYLKKPNEEVNIEKAAYFSPDLLDKSFESEIQKELHLLYKDSIIPDYNIEYFNFLNNSNKRFMALHHITHVTLRNPTNEHIALLKNAYLQSQKSEPFRVYWTKKVDSIMVPFPPINLTFNNGQTIELGKKTKKWMYIDVWATWCPPCIKELPEIEKYYQLTKNNTDFNLDVFTMSYNSTDLNNFLIKKNYTFPVSEITEDMTKLLGITSYPTKYLVSPEGKYLQLPYGNWQEYINNYTLIQIE